MRLDELIAMIPGVQRSGEGWSARCPAHDDSNPSLSISISSSNDGQILLKCHAGCETQAVVAALGLTMKDLFPPRARNGLNVVASYGYHDERGTILYEVCRLDPKDFKQRRSDGNGGWIWKTKGVRQIPYRLPIILERHGAPLIVCEGEKDVHALETFGLLATTNPGGAGKWRFLDTLAVEAIFRDRAVAILPDNDDAGRKHATDVARVAFGQARTVRVVELPGLPNKGDVSDWIAAGGTKDQLLEIIKGTAPLTAKPGRSGNGSAATATPPTGGEERTLPPPLTDAGNAERFVNRHAAEAVYVSAWGKWLLWDGTRWTQDVGERVIRMAIDTARAIPLEITSNMSEDEVKRIYSHALSTEKKERLLSMLRLAQAYKHIPVQDLDSDPWLLNVSNGTIDLRTGALREHDSGDFITKLAPVRYDPSATSDVWDQFLLDVTGGPEGDPELASFLQRAAGYSLTGNTGEEKLFLMHGPGGSGKSTFLEALKATLGDYAMTADFESFVTHRNSGGPRNDIARLAGARLVVSIEVEDGKKLAEGLVKQLTGGDTITARFLFREAFEFTPQFKLWLCCNAAPDVDSEDAALWRRLLRVPFDHVIPKDERDPKIKEALRDPEKGGPSILAWAVQGCIAWQRDGLGVPEIIEQATEDLRQRMDNLGAFFKECCMFGQGLWAWAGDLRTAYENWAKARGDRELAKSSEWAERLAAAGCESQRRGKGSNRGWSGIHIIRSADDQSFSEPSAASCGAGA